ncbi:MAG: tryptophan synthase subunit alpha [Clostridiales bacterium]|nr:tryptophan synthase subunit alpha [Clostridiales bacterium]
MKTNRIQNAFKNGKAFIAFLTGGDPTIEKSEGYILEMARAGADLIEIGIPFSDPIAEGPVIQKANIRALSAGATVEKIFGLAGRVRAKAAVPLVFLTYLNPVFRYGYGNFFRRCADTGVDGVIIPDLPFEEQGEARAASAKNGVDLISLVAPTSQERIRAIARSASGFVYIVSSMGVTGVRSAFETDIAALVRAVKAETRVPAAVGFGVSTPAQAAEIARHADGVIVGSALVRLVEQYGANAAPALREYVASMKAALRGI